MICAICHAPTPPRASTCSACGGDPVLNGRFRLEALLGQGGACSTFRAEDTETGDRVAIKELSIRKVESLKTIELFERETRVLSRLKCPDVPRYVADFTVERPGQVYLYLVQELIDGDNLSGAALGERETLKLVAELCDILATLHASRPPVVHRDVKPSNLMRRRDGRLVLIDFGAVRAVAANSLGGSTVAGTFGYMAPEQLRGQAVPASDLYGVGATAVALLTGRDAAELVDPFRPGGWTREVRVSERTLGLLGRLLAVDPTSRPKDAASVADEARRILAELPRSERSSENEAGTVASPGTGPPSAAPPPDVAPNPRAVRRLRRAWRRVRAQERWRDVGAMELIWPAVMAFIVPSFGMGGCIAWLYPDDHDIPFVYRLIPGMVLAAGVLGWSVWAKLVRTRKNPWRHGAIREAILRSWTETTEWAGGLREELDEDNPKYLARYADSELAEARKAWRHTPWKLIPVFEAKAYRMAHEGEHAAAAAALEEAIATARRSFGEGDVRTLTLTEQYAVVRSLSVDHEDRAVAEHARAEAALKALEAASGRDRRALLSDALVSLDRHGGDGSAAVVSPEAARRAVRTLLRRRRLRGILPRWGDWGGMASTAILGLVVGMLPSGLIATAVYGLATGEGPTGAVLVVALLALPTILLLGGAIYHPRAPRPRDFRVGLFRDADLVWPTDHPARARFLEVATALWRSPYSASDSVYKTVSALRHGGDDLRSRIRRMAAFGDDDAPSPVALDAAQRTQLDTLAVFLARGLEGTYKAVSELDAHPVRDPRARAVALLRAAVSCADAKSPDGAERLAARALALDPTAVEVL